jgi:L-lactate dehydrogenase complex protein LldG
MASKVLLKPRSEPSVDVTVVRSPLGVAETGSILLTEEGLGVSTIAVLAQHLVVFLDPAHLVENINAAYRHPSFDRAAYAVLLSGPSGSTDIASRRSTRPRGSPRSPWFSHPGIDSRPLGP